MPAPRRRTGRPGGRSPRPGAKRPGPKRAAADLPREVVEDVRAAAGGKGNRAVSALEAAVADLDAGRAIDAERAASQAKALAPRSGAVREVLGLALYRRGRFREALRELQAYRRLSGRVDQNHLIADAHRALGAPAKAVDAVREAMEARLPAEVRAEGVVVAGAALADMGRYEEALTLLRRFDRGDQVARPYDLRVWYVLADVLERAGRKRDAERVFRRILRHDPGAFDAADRAARLAAPQSRPSGRSRRVR
jgi:tetratricopeptide (TPR) repeat protein